MRIVLVFLAVLAVSLSCAGQSYTVMSYNIRYNNPGDGRNAWPERKDRLIELVRQSDPDILGVQEALHEQLTDMLEALDGYAMVGVGRDDGKQKGEYSAILYRTALYEVRDQNTFWLSETPEVPGSKSWDAAITRVATWARLFDKRANKEILVVNTHFDHVGKESRLRSAELIRKRIGGMAGDLPVVLSGDFNFTREAPPFAALMSPAGFRLIDSAPANAPGTSCGFEVGARECNGIDYIFFSPQWKLERYEVLTTNNGRDYPSDHLPVLVNLRLVAK